MSGLFDMVQIPTVRSDAGAMIPVILQLEYALEQRDLCNPGYLLLRQLLQPPAHIPREHGLVGGSDRSLRIMQLLAVVAQAPHSRFLPQRQTGVARFSGHTASMPGGVTGSMNTAALTAETVLLPR